jgi:hypothetical protein
MFAELVDPFHTSHDGRQEQLSSNPPPPYDGDHDTAPLSPRLCKRRSVSPSSFDQESIVSLNTTDSSHTSLSDPSCTEPDALRKAS